MSDTKKIDFRLPAELIDKLDQHTLLNGCKNRTQTVISLLEQALKINQLSDVVRDEIFNLSVKGNVKNLTVNDIKLAISALNL